MKLYVSADIEGITGIADWREADPAKPDYAEFRERMTEDCRAVCEAAIAAGVTEILVKDAHGPGRNLLAERLPQQAGLVRGWSGHPFCMVQELDATFDAAMFVGYHARAGSGGNPLAHTLSSAAVREILVNGEPFSEFRIHALAAATVGVPVVLVSGDQTLCAEVHAVNPAIETVAATRGEGWSTVAPHPATVRRQLQDATTRALTGDLSSCALDVPDRFSVEVRYKDQRKAYRNSFYPGARLETPHAVAFETGDFFEVLRLLQFVT